MFRLLIFICFLFVASSTAAQNGKDDGYKQRAQKAIDACWAISQEDRDSGVTPRMRAGALNTALCMEEHILELSENYLFPDSPDLISETKKNLEEIRSGYGRLYWNLYNSLDACFRDKNGRFLSGCGTLFHVFHNGAYAHLLEDIILDFYRQIQEYELDRD